MRSELISSIITTEKTLELHQYGKITDERKRLKVNFGPSNYQPSGLYIKANQEMTVTLHETDQVVNPRLVISPPILNKYQDGILEGEELKHGDNLITHSEGGIIYFINESDSTDKPAIVTVKGAQIIPTFESEKTTLSEWKELLLKYPKSPVFELVTSKVIITAEMSLVNLVMDPVELLEAHDVVVDLQAKLSGLSPHSSSLHRTTEFKYHYRQTEEQGFWMYAWLNHTGYSKEGMAFVLDINKFTSDGWGPWHELGHVHQQTAWTPELFTEVTTNLYSLTVQRYFGLPSRLETDNIYEKAFQYLDSTSKDFSDVDIWEKLVMFWQLDLAYGEEIYPLIHKLVRETPESELPTNDEDKVQKIMFWASQATKQNLIPFFEKWGVNITDENKKQIKDLGYPVLGADIWRNSDSNNMIKPRDLS